jgi:hypothetical protein
VTALPDGFPATASQAMVDNARDAMRRRSGPEHVEEARRLAAIGVAQLTAAQELVVGVPAHAAVVEATTSYARGLIELAQVHATLAGVAGLYDDYDPPWWQEHPFPDPPQPQGGD